MENIIRVKVDNLVEVYAAIYTYKMKLARLNMNVNSSVQIIH